MTRRSHKRKEVIQTYQEELEAAEAERKRLIKEMTSWWKGSDEWRGLKKKWNLEKLLDMPLKQVKAIYFQRYILEVAQMNAAKVQIPLFPELNQNKTYRR